MKTVSLPETPRGLSGSNGFAAGAPLYLLQGVGESLLAQGVRSHPPSGPLDTLATRTAHFFATQKEGPRILIGALPFDTTQPDFLYQPREYSRESAVPSRPEDNRAAPIRGHLATEPSVAHFQDAISRSLARMTSAGAIPAALRKVVLSRSLLLKTDTPIDRTQLVARLAALDPSVTTFLVPLPSLASGQERVLVGATPELLVAKTGRAIVSHPLAGSARRQRDGTADRVAAGALEHSEKDQREHAAVVESILDTLAPFCAQLRAPQRPALRATATMWHLGSRIEGELKDSTTSSATLAAALHPTPAVAGVPRNLACEAIRDLEGYDRGFYTGAVGWTQENGDGAWHVAIRCAEIAGTKLRLYAGAGIVPGSDPARETEETSAKFLTLLHALGLNEAGQPLRHETR